jgi:hypothetical protein
VLLNRAHRYPDLVLKINEAQCRLLNEIGGRRTLEELISGSGGEEARALEFFEQLWQYDQIVFDASQACAK